MAKVNLVYAAPDAVRLLGSCGTATSVSRTWVLNDIGTATYELPITQPDLSRIVELGAINWLYEDGVPPFVGYVEERSWTDSSVRVGLRSAEGLLRGQLTRQGLVLGADGQASVGTVAYNVFLSGVLRNSTVPLRAGIFDAEGARFVEYSYADVFDAFSKLAENYRAAFWVDENLTVHFRSQRGADKTGSVVLVQGRNLINVQITETIAETINAAVGLGEGNDLAKRPKKALRFTPVGQFKAEVLTLSGAADSETVTKMTEDELRKRRHPKITIDAELVKTAPEWGQFFLGDIVKVVSSVVPWGNEYNCRVVGVEIGQEDKMRLVLSVIPQTIGETPTTWTLT